MHIRNFLDLRNLELFFFFFSSNIGEDIKFLKFSSFPEISGKHGPRSPGIKFSCKNKPVVFPRHLQVFRRCRQMPENLLPYLRHFLWRIFGYLADKTPIHLNNTHTHNDNSLPCSLTMTDTSLILCCRPFHL